MTYNPFIPQPPDLPSDSQGDFLSNFGLINNFFGNDHVPFGNSIEDATLSNPIVITSTTHRLTTGNTVTVTSMRGRTPENVIEDWPINGSTFTVTVIDENTFSLNASDSTAYPPYIVNTGDFVSPDIDYGFHLKNFFPEAFNRDPNRNNPISSYYTKLDTTNVPNLFFQNGINSNFVKQLTELEVTNQTGAGRGFKTPWGLIINMGSVFSTSQNFTTYSFPVPFTTKGLTIIFTISRPKGPVNTSPIIVPVGAIINNTQFRVQTQRSGSSVVTGNIFYIAIGI